MEKKKKKLEKDIQNEIFEYLQSKKFLFWRSNNIPVYGKNNGGKYMYRSLPKYTPRGLPDIMVVVNGHFIAIEVKREGAKLRPSQAEFGMRVQAHYGTYVVAYSVDDVKKIPELQ